MKIILMLAFLFYIFSKIAQTMESPDKNGKVVDIVLLNVEDKGSNVYVNYCKRYASGKVKNCRQEVSSLSNGKQAVMSAECLGKVFRGFIKGDVRLLFAVKRYDGSMELVQAREGSKACMALLQKSMGCE